MNNPVAYAPAEDTAQPLAEEVEEHLPLDALVALGKERGWVSQQEIELMLEDGLENLSSNPLAKLFVPIARKQTIQILEKSGVEVRRPRDALDDESVDEEASAVPAAKQVPAVPGLLAHVPVENRADVLASTAANLARDVSATLVHNELANYGKGLRQIQRETGLQPAVISRVATGANANGPELATLYKIALAMGKTVQVSFVDQRAGDDDD